jgi:hypothetical protein
MGDADVEATSDVVFSEIPGIGALAFRIWGWAGADVATLRWLLELSVAGVTSPAPISHNRDESGSLITGMNPGLRSPTTAGSGIDLAAMIESSRVPRTTSLSSSPSLSATISSIFDIAAVPLVFPTVAPACGMPGIAVALKVGSSAETGAKLEDEAMIDSDETGVMPGAVLITEDWCEDFEFESDRWMLLPVEMV